jgi:hypothetical protein
VSESEMGYENEKAISCDREICCELGYAQDCDCDYGLGYGF